MTRGVRWSCPLGAMVITALCLAPLPARAGTGQGPGGDDAARAASSSSRRHPDRAHSLSVTVSGDWLGSSSLGASAATETPNDGGQRFVLFRAEGRLQGAPGIETRLAYALTPSLSVEAGLAYSRPAVQLAISNDAEGAARATFENAEMLSQYLVDGAALVHLHGLDFAHGRALPFVEAGAGYLRQLHEGRALVETGQVFYLGGGLKYFFAVRPASRVSGLAFRADARAAYRRKGFAFEDKTRLYPVLSAGLVVAF